MGQEFPPVQTGPGAHPASCTMGTESFPGRTVRPGRTADRSSPASTVVMEDPLGHNRACKGNTLHFTCFGFLCAHHQEKIAFSMRPWHLSLCMSGVWSAGWVEINEINNTLNKIVHLVGFICKIVPYFFVFVSGLGAESRDRS